MSTALRRVSLREQALDVLRQALVSGEIKPGDIYSAAALAERLGVSNSPVREAMLTLVHEGLMEAVPNRGFRVVPLSDADLDEIYQLRLLLEVPAMVQLAERGIAGERERFELLAQDIEQAAADRDVIRFLEADRAFHLELLGLLGNARLVSIVANLRDQTRLYGLKALARQDKLGASAAEHRQLLAAIDAGDASAVDRLARAHLEHTRGEWAGTDQQ
ncbi:GntR family transcriptional regulator [Mycolicibacterium wolinskyi]|uniref:GntR family transcriptional regulator n=1 Tax=Mycolicibacterium TaxID=1866885 RepID=UPI001F44C0AA|nr:MULTISPECIES: GntR family transcriptional regulator [Mycolicibacterium]MCV7288207.1 GntR family transcriptional regulator [Mycolicibacterium wolinskyi]MCV7295429.1 GntR family transcriptional regulator [Mycolicibacterium goodii]